MVTPVLITVTPVPNTVNVPAPMPNVPIAVTPVTNAVAVPALMPNVTSVGINKRPSILYDVTNTVARQSAGKYQQEKRTGRKSKDEK